MINILKDFGLERLRREGDKMGIGRIALRNELRKKLGEEILFNKNTQDKLIDATEKGILKYGVFNEKEKKFYESKEYTIRADNSMNGRPGYFFIDENTLDVKQISLTKIKSFEESKYELPFIYIDNNLPPRGQRNHLRWNN